MNKRRWVYTNDGHPLAEPIEVTADWEGTPRGGSRRSEAEIYDNLRTSDGTDVSSRAKLRAYCKKRGLTNVRDYDQPGGEWERAAKRREAIRSGELGHERRTQQVAQAWYHHKRSNTR